MLIGAEKLTQLLASSLEYWNNAVMRAELLQREALILLDQLKMWFRHLRTNSATSLMAGSRPGSELPSSTLAAGSWLGPGHVLVSIDPRRRKYCLRSDKVLISLAGFDKFEILDFILKN